MKAVTVMNLYFASFVALVVGWMINVAATLNHPNAGWDEVTSPPLLAAISIWFLLLADARAKVHDKARARSPEVMSLGAGGARLAAIAALGILATYLLGLSLHR